MMDWTQHDGVIRPIEKPKPRWMLYLTPEIGIPQEVAPNRLVRWLHWFLLRWQWVRIPRRIGWKEERGHFYANRDWTLELGQMRDVRSRVDSGDPAEQSDPDA